MPRNLSNLRSLDLSGNRLSLEPGVFNGMSRLEVLALMDAHLELDSGA